jgi:hypothetical protein
VEHAVGKQSEPAKEGEVSESVSEESESFERKPLEEIISHFGISAVHPVADLMPAVSDEEFQALCRDIKVQGIFHLPRVNDAGVLLDGRTRLQAAYALGIDLEIERFKPPDEVAYIVSENVYRRHLTAAQRALIAAEIANLAHGGDRKTDTFKSGHPILKTRGEAARLADSAPEAISQVRLIREWAPEEIPAMQAGRQNLEEAYRRAQKKKYEDEGKPPPKRKKQSKQKKNSADNATVAIAPPVAAAESEAPTEAPDEAGLAVPISETSSRKDHVNGLWSLFELLLKGDDEVYDEPFLASLQLDIDIYRAAWPRFRGMARAVREFLEKQPQTRE